MYPHRMPRLLIPAILFLGLVVSSGCGRRGGETGRVVVIGLDGATWDLLQPWIDRGDLPNLAALQQTSAWGELQSVVPYLSPAAWASAVTGVNPGKHAIFDFQRRMPGQAVIVNETAKSRRAQPIWNMLRPSKRRVLLLNIPMTDPPDEVNGLFIAGFPHQDLTGYTYPPDLERKIQPYELDRLEMRLVPGREDSLLATYARCREYRKRIILDWLRNEPFDLLWAVFTGTDRIQHTFWLYADPQNPNYDPVSAQRYVQAIHDYWVEQDRALGEIMAAVGSDATLLVVSDHGFGPLRYDLRVQNLLRAPGSELSSREADGIYSLDRGDAARLYVSRRGRDPGAIWSPTEALGVRGKLAGALRRAEDPRTGGRVCETVWGSEEVFRGTYAEKGPDLVALPAEGYFLTLGDPAGDVAGPVVGPHTPQLSGWHRMNGIYAVRGPGIAPGRRGNEGDRLCSLLDIVPTVLYLLDEPIPAGLDGDLMRGLLGPDRLAKKPPRAAGPLEEDYREMTPEEMQNLRNLPYIGG